MNTPTELPRLTEPQAEAHARMIEKQRALRYRYEEYGDEGARIEADRLEVLIRWQEGRN